MAGVDSFSVVVLDPGCKGCCSTSIAGEGLPVYPLGGEGPVEPFASTGIGGSAERLFSEVP